jgi:hypothetical protein
MIYLLFFMFILFIFRESHVTQIGAVTGKFSS